MSGKWPFPCHPGPSRVFLVAAQRHEFGCIDAQALPGISGWPPGSPVTACEGWSRIEALEPVALGPPPTLLLADVQRCSTTLSLGVLPLPGLSLHLCGLQPMPSEKVPGPRRWPIFLGPATSVPGLGSQQPPRHGSQRLGHRLGKRERELPQQSEQIRTTCLSRFSCPHTGCNRSISTSHSFVSSAPTINQIRSKTRGERKIRQH